MRECIGGSSEQLPFALKNKTGLSSSVSSGGLCGELPAGHETCMDMAGAH